MSLVDKICMNQSGHCAVYCDHSQPYDLRCKALIITVSYSVAEEVSRFVFLAPAGMPFATPTCGPIYGIITALGT